ncbi:hypothetical protein EV182_002802 [Spiromyces aspiralis]|uniref:Uncharacterized protein n=1 Tax=Spiromyces aspiralis TaxID=68401 RepID=A0ACC1HR88_9FUNG|nr:hypothetical protein EV182_002802 [Spiromyces aspiralis]
MTNQKEPKPVGLLACQVDPYLWELETEVHACSAEPNADGFYEVELLDTVLFPEGGGQPSDRGTIGSAEVRHVYREALRAIHLTSEKFEGGARVRVKVDPERRLDHMQQHSGQHLLSAILEREYGLETVACKSHVELKTDKTLKLDPGQQAEIERRCNEAICRRVPVTVETSAYNTDALPSSLPDDYVGGVVRHVVIDGLDRNACCGTHVTNLAELQAIKLCHTDRIRGGNTRLFFLVGDRVLRRLHEAQERERRLTSLLSCGPDAHVAAVERTQLLLRDASKHVRSLQSEVAEGLATRLVQQLARGPLAVLHRDGADSALLFSIVRAIGDTGAAAASSPPLARGVVMLTGGSAAAGGGGGPVLIAGDEALVARSVEVLRTHIPAMRGGGKGSLWRGKSTDWAGLDRAHAAISAAVAGDGSIQ